jgi:predicted metal-dependent hydrolase
MQLGLPLDVPEFYYVRHQLARRYVLRVDADGRVRVTIPRGGSRREASLFAAKNLAWIEQQRARLPRPIVPHELRGVLRRRAAAELPPAVLARATELGLKVTRVSIRDQRSRWGSCGPDGHISLNWRLIVMPEWVRDYVIVHELMHLRRMDHSRAYWTLVAGVYPHYRKARTWLREHGPALR